MFTSFTGSRTGINTRIVFDTAADAEQIIIALGGDDACIRYGVKANSIRKAVGRETGINIPGPALYWKALLTGDIENLVNRIRVKGVTSAQSALSWGIPRDLVARAIAEAGRPDVCDWWEKSARRDNADAMNAAQVADFLQIAQDVVRTLATAGKIDRLPPEQGSTPRKPLYSRQSVERYREERRHNMRWHGPSSG